MVLCTQRNVLLAFSYLVTFPVTLITLAQLTSFLILLGKIIVRKSNTQFFIDILQNIVKSNNCQQANNNALNQR